MIQGAARARAASPTPTPATALSAIELLEKDRLWTTRKELVDDINHFQCTQNKNMKSVTEGSAGGKCLILRCDCAVTALPFSLKAGMYMKTDLYAGYPDKPLRLSAVAFRDR